MDKKVGKVFVYGTLKVGGFFGEKFNDVRIRSVPATVKGTLYHIPAFFPSSFPGLKLDGNSVVHGELHTFKDFMNVLAAIDRIEQYNAEEPEFSMYVRSEADVETKEGTEKAMIYEYNGPVDDYKVVRNGTWIID